MTGQIQRACCVLLTVVLLCAYGSEGSGQTKPEPPPRRPVPILRDTTLSRDSSSAEESLPGSKSRLPVFDVPEYTITGEETGSPSNTPRPLQAEYSARSAYRSDGPGMRDPAAAVGNARRPAGGYGGNRYGGGVRVGYGSFYTPALDLWLSYGAQQTDLLLSTGYSSTRGHVAHAQSQKASNTISGGFGVLGTRVRATLGLSGDGYRLYGSDWPTRWRTVNGVQGDVEVGSIRIGNGGIYSGMHFRSTVLEDSLRSTEYQLGFDLNFQTTAGPVRIMADAELLASVYSNGMDMLNPHLHTLALRARYTVLPAFDVEAGIRAGVRRGTDVSAVGWVDPLLAFYWRGWSGITAYMRFEPYAEKASLMSLSAENPYVTGRPHLRPRHYATNLLTGVAFRPGSNIRCSAELFYLRGHDVPVFVDQDTTGIWTPVYGGVVRSAGLRGSIAADLSPDDIVHATLTIRNARWSGIDTADPRLSGDAVPNMPGLEIDAFSIHRFPFGLTLAPSMRLAGSRPVDPANSRSLTSYLDIGFRAEYIVLPSFTVALTFENLFGTKRTFWDGYPGVPATAALSGSYSW